MFDDHYNPEKAQRAQKINRDRSRKDQDRFEDGPRIRRDKPKDKGRKGWGMESRFNIN